MKAFAALPLAFVCVMPSSEPRQAPSGFEILGVCSLADATPACWDEAGRPLPELLKDLDERLEDYPFGVRFMVGKKNRYVILKRSDAYAIRFHPDASVNFVLTLGGRNRPAVELMRVATPFEAQSWKVQAEIALLTRPSRDVELRKGRTADVAGNHVEIGDIAVADAQSLRGFVALGPEGSPLWSVVIGQSVESSLGDGLNFAPLDSNGKVITFVDPEGRPVSRERVMRDVAQAQKDANYKRFPAFAARFEAGSSFQGHPLVLRRVSNVDPKRIAKLRITRMVAREETLGPFALEPV